MRSPRRGATAVVLAGAVVLSSTAYGIGTQVDDGSAVAENGRARGGDPGGRQPGPGPGLDDLASSLGVDADRLEDALRDFHEQQEGERRDGFAAALAGALGISADRVEAGLDALEEKRLSRLSSRLSDELGVSAGKVKAALERLADGRPRDPFGFAEALARELGVSVQSVKEALWNARPGQKERHRPGAMPLRELALALDVTRGELREAFRELRAGARSHWEDGREELVGFLAERFDLSAEKVEDALPQMRGGPRPGRPAGQGPHGPGGPGPPGPLPFGPGR